jgi:hypothetical protein
MFAYDLPGSVHNPEKQAIVRNQKKNGSMSRSFHEKRKSNPYNASIRYLS